MELLNVVSYYIYIVHRFKSSSYDLKLYYMYKCISSSARIVHDLCYSFILLDLYYFKVAIPVTLVTYFCKPINKSIIMWLEIWTWRL